MESSTDKSPTVAQRRNRLALTWIDFLVIAAIILTFAAIVSTTLGRAKASSHDSVSSINFSTEISQIPDMTSADGPWT